MPTTRRQQAIKEGKIRSEKAVALKKRRRSIGGELQEESTSKRQEVDKETEKPASKRNTSPKTRASKLSSKDRKPVLKASTGKPASKMRAKPKQEVGTEDTAAQERKGDAYKPGTIERGHIYFFYRPKVEHAEARSIDEVRNFHILLIPRPPAYAVDDEPTKSTAKTDPSMTEEAEMKVLQPGADAVPAPVTHQTTKQHYRVLSVGKKRLPDPEEASGKGHRKETFWALVTSIGDDLTELAESFGPEEYETKTRGRRHQAAARLIARGGYAIVNAEAHMPSERETHLGYHVSHPSPADMGDVQARLGIHSSSSFVLQIKNPLAPSTNPRMSHVKAAEYPESIMKNIFGQGRGKGRESYGLRFASCETPELLDAVGAQVLMIAAREGEQGLEMSLGEGRGEALVEAESEESKIDIDKVFQEIGLDTRVFTHDVLEGEWA